ncbi:MAG: hypothetical protein U5P41_09590 [Gammaproteobacteria bacterium]|nr:hypothetical protein [Gammaproteobacteria bacterium]
MPYRLYNIGNHSLVWLMDFISTLEIALGKKAERQMRCPCSRATCTPATRMSTNPPRPRLFTVNFIKRRTGKFVAWYRDYYGIDQEGGVVQFVIPNAREFVIPNVREFVIPNAREGS